MAYIKGLWARYLTWRNTPTDARVPVPERTISKVAASDADIATSVTANIGGPGPGL